MSLLHFMQLCMVLPSIPLVVFIVRRPRTSAMKGIAPLLCVNAYSGIHELFINPIIHMYFRVWFRIDILLGFLAMCYYFSRLVPGIRRFIRVMILIFLVMYIVTIWLWVRHGMEKSDSVLSCLNLILIYVGSIAWFRALFSKMEVRSLWLVPDFYFISGFILYFSGTLFLFMMDDFVFTDVQSSSYWFINLWLSIFLQIMLTIGVWKGKAA